MWIFRGALNTSTLPPTKCACIGGWSSSRISSRYLLRKRCFVVMPSWYGNNFNKSNFRKFVQSLKAVNYDATKSGVLRWGPRVKGVNRERWPRQSGCSVSLPALFQVVQGVTDGFIFHAALGLTQREFGKLISDHSSWLASIVMPQHAARKVTKSNTSVCFSLGKD